MQGGQISMPVNRMTGQHFPNFFCRTNERLGPSEQINFIKFWAEFAKNKKNKKTGYLCCQVTMYSVFKTNSLH